MAELAAQGLLALLKSFHISASEILLLADDWYTVSDEYVSQVDMLRRRLDEYAKQRLMYGNVSEEDYMMRVLQRANHLLKIEEKKVKWLDGGINESKCCGMVWLLYSRLTMTVVPQRVERIVKKVTAELDRIPSHLKSEVESADLLRKHFLLQPISTPKRNNDGLYVSIKSSESAVTHEIENSKGHPIVLLQGGVGKGKSVLARYVCARYGTGGDKGDMFENVFLLECGNGVIPDPSTLLSKVLRSLAPTMVGGEGDSSPDRIEGNLRAFFSEKKILIILDDLLDPTFLQKMCSVRGKDVKYLVTSQKSNLCDSSTKECAVIPMQDPTKEEARKILASLVGLGGQEIPDDLLDIANQMIEATERNPLALACLASSFSCGKNVILERTRWEHAYTQLRELLDKPGTRSVYEGTVSTSLWTAMKASIDSLGNEDAKKLLFLMYACEGPSVAEEVLKVLFERTKSRSGAFYSEMDELVMRELVERSSGTRAPGTKSEDQDQDDYLHKSTVWSLRSLVKLYMQHNGIGKDEIKPVADLLVGRDIIEKSTILGHEEIVPEIDEMEVEEIEKGRLAAALCALYFDRAHRDKLVRDMANNNSAPIVRKYNKAMNDLRRDAIEPLIRLLGQPVVDNWTEGDQRCVRKVFLEYIRKGKLEVEGIANLLKLSEYPSAQLATLRAVREICRIEEKNLLDDDPECIFEALADLLDIEKVEEGIRAAALRTRGASLQDGFKEVPYRLLEETCNALVILSWKTVEDKSGVLISGKKSLLEGLGRLVHDSNVSRSLRVHAAQTLWNLMLGGDDIPGPLWVLNDILCERDKPGDLCEPAVEALYCLACGLDSEIIKRIVNLHWALQGLVRALTNIHNPLLQTSAANVLGLLAWGGEDSIRMAIVLEDGALDGLVEALSEHKDAHLRERAASALANLALGEAMAPRFEIVEHKDALERLVKSLREYQNPGLQERAARAIGNLALGSRTDEPRRMTIVKKILDLGALDDLFKLSQEQTSTRVSEVATLAQKNLLYRMDTKVLGNILQVVHDSQHPRRQEGAKTQESLEDLVQVQTFSRLPGLPARVRHKENGEGHEFDYDEKKKRWVEKEAEDQPEEAALPHPVPTKFVSKVEDASPPDTQLGDGDAVAPASASNIAYLAPPPILQNYQLSAPARQQGVRARYVDTFYNRSNTTTPSKPAFSVISPVTSLGGVPLQSINCFVPGPVPQMDSVHGLLLDSENGTLTGCSRENHYDHDSESEVSETLTPP